VIRVHFNKLIWYDPHRCELVGFFTQLDYSCPEYQSLLWSISTVLG